MGVCMSLCVHAQVCKFVYVCVSTESSKFITISQNCLNVTNLEFRMCPDLLICTRMKIISLSCFLPYKVPLTPVLHLVNQFPVQTLAGILPVHQAPAP